MTPTGIIATTYLKIRGIPFVIEGDGGFPKYSESKLKTKIKKFFLKKALWYLSSGKSHTDYYKYYEVDQSKIINYHFSSVSEKDIIKKIFSNKDKMTIKKKYNIENERVILYVGRFVISKGLDILFEALREIKTNYLLILVGDNEETFEKLPLITFDVNYKVMGFKTKDELREVYDMSDFLVLPTRGDVWGLVINEAFARGLPVISTNKSGAAIELIENSSNGFIIESENFKQLKDKLRILLSENLTDISNHALNKIRMYTIEQMTKDHESLLGINK
jgi:glycosyltransferase involved in cell wall biosynthesis